MQTNSQTEQVHSPESELKSKLDALETAVATPIVSGDYASWLAEVLYEWNSVSSEIRDHTLKRHAEQFEEIGQQDPELLPRIEKLQQEDEQTEQQRHWLDERASWFAALNPPLGLDETKAQQLSKELVDEVTAFIVRVKRQSVAVQTWYVEAFNRDRGAVD